MDDPKGSRCGVGFDEVFARELGYVQKRWRTVYADRADRNERKLASDATQSTAEGAKAGPRPERTTEHGLVGLAFSGGGIRSATINLGIAQALHQRGVFDHVDYISTVSGGGYLGSSISTAMRMLPADEDRKAFARGKGEFPYAVDFAGSSRAEGQQIESPFLTWVRNNSNYLVTGGFLDFARMGGVLLRGILVNFLVLLPILLALATILYWRYDDELDGWKRTAQAAAKAGQQATAARASATRMAELAQASSCTGDASCAQRAAAAEQQARAAEEAAQTARQAVPSTASFFRVAVLLAGLFVVLALVFPVLIRVYKGYKHRQQLQTGQESSVGSRSSVEMVFAYCLTAVGVVALIETLPILIHYFHHLRDADWRELSAALASGTALVAMSAAGKVHSRLGGLKQKLTLLAVGLLGLIIPLVVMLYVTEGLIYGAWGAINTFDLRHPLSAPAEGAANAALWLLPGTLLIIFGGGLGSAMVGLFWRLKLRWLASTIATIAGAVFGYYLIHWLSRLLAAISGGPADIWPTTFVLGSAAVILLFCYLWVNVNLTSVLGLYRDRLASAYLIGLRKKRDKDGNLTNEQEIFIEPDLDLKDLCGGTPPTEEPKDPKQCPDWRSQVTCHASKAPYHIVNTALNLQGSNDPLLRDRDSDFLMFSKYYYGGKRTGYCRTEDLETVFPQMDLPTAMAISAAAASPNAGRMTNKPLVVLLTLFNIRLGYWVPHPGRLCQWLRQKTKKNEEFKPTLWHRLGWRIPPWALLREMFSLVDEKHRWVNLSDGAHIESMGVYELLRRRCRYIICGDGEADASLTFGGLATLMRSARIDMGIEIEILLDDLRLGDGGASHQHAALGRINYPPLKEGGKQEEGLLLYIKSSFTGNEDETIQEYRAKNPDFPHQTTADQFFDEGQFEAYRALGFHMADGLFPPIEDGKDPRQDWEGFEDWFGKLQADLAPRLSARHMALRDQLRRISKLLRRPEYHYYFYQLHPQLDDRSPEQEKADSEKQAGLPEITHLVGLQLDLMENAFLRLNLDHRMNWNHPGNAGWRTLFEAWARPPDEAKGERSTLFRDAYEFLGHRHSGRFQNFSERSLKLPPVWDQTPEPRE